MISHGFKLIMFDFDGTLVDSQAGIHRCMSEAFAENGLTPPDLAAVRRIVGLKLEYAVAENLPDKGDMDLACRVADSYRHAFMRFRASPDFVEPTFPRVHETLDLLNRPDALLGIATGKNLKGLQRSLEHHRLTDYFVTLKAAEHGRGKPDPDILLQAIAENGVEPEETVMIGDTSYDMGMAVAAGTAAVGVSWGYHAPEELTDSGAHIVLNDFADLLSALADLRR